MVTKDELYLINKILEYKTQTKPKIMIQKLQQELDKLRKRSN